MESVTALTVTLSDCPASEAHRLFAELAEIIRPKIASVGGDIELETYELIPVQKVTTS